MDDNNKYPILRTGDRILSRRITGPIKYFSNCLAWFLHSNWSHVVPVIDSNVCLDILWPKSKIVSNSIFLSPDYKIMILRPRIEFTVEQNIKWIAAANLLSGEEYDLESFAGFLLDKPSIQNSCSKGDSPDVFLRKQESGLSPKICKTFPVQKDHDEIRQLFFCFFYFYSLHGPCPGI